MKFFNVFMLCVLGQYVLANPQTEILVSEKQERRILENNNGKAKLLYLTKSDSSHCIWIGVHGIKDSPSSVTSLSQTLEECDKAVLVYDDMTTRLKETVALFKRDLEQVYKNYHDIYIDAHSMGARITLAALNNQEIESHVHIRANFIAPHLAGDKKANHARKTFWPITLIPGVRPGIDMGTRSSFQRSLNTVSVADNISITVWTGDNDRIIRADRQNFENIVRNINATWNKVDDHDHVSIIEYVSKALVSQGR